MAAKILFLDSFDHYATAQLGLKWNSVIGANCTVASGNQRTGSQCLHIGGGAFGPRLTFSSLVTVVGSSAYNPVGGRGGGILVLGSDTDGQVWLNANGSGQVSVTNNVFGDTTPPAFNIFVPAQFNQVQGVYARYELKVTCGNPGSFILRINGVQALNVTGVQTNPHFTGVLNFFQLNGAGGGVVDSCHDDTYLATDFLGDIIVVENTPNADGHYAAWTPLVAGPHFSQVNEIPPDGDVSYVSSSNIGDIDTYKIPNTGYTPPIQVLGVQSVIYCRKDLAGTRIIAPVIRQGGVDAVMADFSLPLTTYTYAKQVYDLGGDTSLNPATGLAWTQADLTAAEFGQKVTG